MHAERRPIRLSYGLAMLVAVVVAGCGGASAEEGPPSLGAAEDPGAIHVHALGYDASRDVLYIATHTGLFELPKGAERARRIAGSRHDVMGFTLLKPGLFLGSGHPDLRDEELPPHLGLRSSRNRGRTWQSVSLLGEADFHVLRARGETVYGFDSRSGALLVSSDAGRTWTPRPVPEPFVDIAIDPGDVDHVLASGDTALHETRDGGRRWKPVAVGLGGQLAWPRRSRIFVADEDGSILMGARAGGRWRLRSRLDGRPAALLAVDDRRLFVALHDGAILLSVDAGATWTERARP